MQETLVKNLSNVRVLLQTVISKSSQVSQFISQVERAVEHAQNKKWKKVATTLEGVTLWSKQNMFGNSTIRQIHTELTVISELLKQNS